MTAGILALNPFIEGSHLAIALFFKIFIGVTLYPATVLFMWWFCGKPYGPEYYVLEKTLNIMSRSKKVKSSPSRL